ncbi:protein of unknown function [Moritella yayanosii]|uniref:Uncharacterized protein n=1 Tax=Moritella yayanosii TaxID=69539 RepID=A0A330LTB3_9GAMM|nr:protein of unknown function [Moritella yayanosii]
MSRYVDISIFCATKLIIFYSRDIDDYQQLESYTIPKLLQDALREASWNNSTALQYFKME